MTDISVIILIGQEKIHLKRCVEKLAPLDPKCIWLVESQPDDGGVAIAEETAEVFGLRLEHVFNGWPGNQAAQYNWFIDNYKIDTEWVLRIDADEWLTHELIDEIKKKLPRLPKNLNGVHLKRRSYFAGGWAKHGTYPVKILRLYRNGKARYAEHAVMDERLLVEGRVIEFEHDFVDESLISMDEWRDKHRSYAEREAVQAIDGTFPDLRKATYYKLPRYFRALAYFCIRYFLKGGFLDGYVGLKWNFWQGLWYRWIVDQEIGKLRRVKNGSGLAA